MSEATMQFWRACTNNVSVWSKTTWAASWIQEFKLFLLFWWWWEDMAIILKHLNYEALELWVLRQAVHSKDMHIHLRPKRESVSVFAPVLKYKNLLAYWPNDSKRVAQCTQCCLYGLCTNLTRYSWSFSMRARPTDVPSSSGWSSLRTDATRIRVKRSFTLEGLQLCSTMGLNSGMLSSYVSIGSISQWMTTLLSSLSAK